MGIVYVHAWTGLYGPSLSALADTPQGLLRWGLIELLGRSSVPLLSMISGWLVGPSLARRGWRRFLAGKVRAVLVPMVAWNLIAIVVVSGAALAGWLYAPHPEALNLAALDWLANELLAFRAPNEINVQMPFLRDLFVCLVAAPLLVRARTPLLGAIALMALVWSLFAGGLPWGFYVLQRPSILAFFVLGMLARRGDLAARVGGWPLGGLVLPYLAMAGLKIWLEVFDAAEEAAHPLVFALADLAMRAATALCFWALAWRLAGEGRMERLGDGLLRAEPYVFLMFCAHLILIWCAGPAIGQITGPLGAPAYPLFLLGQPVLALGGAVVLGQALRRVHPGLARVLSGGRLE